jgi:2-polyprenyl-3-methyl-5-hydroxy-6-metoxy-1,4-benzoquinol methylase
VRKTEFESRIAGIRTFGHRENLVLNSCRGRSVLDVGCVGQARNHDSEHWLHGQLRKVASNLIGVDINRTGREELRIRGYDVLLPEELEGRTFERIVMGDVVEHVDNPVAFLEFYAKCLADEGRIVLTTPNAFSALQLFWIATRNRVWVNPEHICFFDPLTLAEVVERAGLEIVNFAWLKTVRRGRLQLKGRVLLAVGALAQRARPYLAEDFFVELARPSVRVGA